MKAEHRHDLKTNELAEWIANFPQWAKKNLLTIIYVSVLVVVVAGAYIYRKYQTTIVVRQAEHKFTNLLSPLQRRKMNIIQNQSTGQDDAYRLIRSARNFKAVAEETKNVHMSALALIKYGEILRSELHYRLESASRQETENQINDAMASYRAAIEKAPDNPTLVAKATFGIGLCQEELGNFEEAEKIYRDIIANAEFEGTVAVAQAQYRLDTMSDYREQIVFKASPRPKPKAVSLPQEIKLEPADINLPIEDR